MHKRDPCATMSVPLNLAQAFRSRYHRREAYPWRIAMRSRRAAVAFFGMLSVLSVSDAGRGQEKPQPAVHRPALVPQLGHANVLTAVAFSVDGKYAYTGSHDKTVRVWEVLTGREIITLEGHTSWIIAVAGSKDG